jgi:serine/threonine protein kinase
MDTLCQVRTGDGWKGLKLGRVIARGANSTVNAASFAQGGVGDDDDAHQCVVARRPRHQADTRSKEYAVAEYQHSIVAASCHAGPIVHDAFYVRHATRYQRRGLHMVLDRMKETLEDAVLADEPQDGPLDVESLAPGIVTAVRALAGVGMLHFDLKPKNIMLDADRNARVIDFGCEFCQHVDTPHPGPHAMGSERLIFDTLPAEVKNDTERRTRVLAAVMLIQLCATTDALLRDAAQELKTLSTDARLARNPVRRPARDAYDELRVAEIPVVRQVLRHPSVRATTAHYCGSRNAHLARVFRCLDVDAPCVK